MIHQIAVSGYRSLRDLTVVLGGLTIITGPNGSGKSSFYRALRLMNDIAHGGIIRSLAAEGGLPSTLWAGPESFARSVKQGQHPVEGTRRKNPVALKLGFAGDDYSYAIELGLPVGGGHFALDPEIKLEALWIGAQPSRHNVLAERHGPSVRIRDKANAWAQAETALAAYDSMMTHCADPREAQELLVVRERMRNWRFYDHLRTDAEAPARRPQIGTRTPALSGDGSDLAAAIQTIREVGDADALDTAIEHAFPGHTVEVATAGTYFEIEMRQPGLLRPLKATELSEGTLKFLLLVGALFSPRPPGLMVLNEPETSLHVDLIPALARAIGEASARTQIILVTHSEALIGNLRGDFDCRQVRLRKELGETLAEQTEEPGRWVWPKR
ncbi:AAA family ATPase [Dongia sedimenti]|uniref:AAA family ATPase n=1 Tax=Dongia sedimenti TaxID=3064282 RepID=A0ABU0YJ76_9PROT|nr:AAA family ATPase [Rhodospirillaceae bacterium R-7]